MDIGTCLVSWPELVAKWNAHVANRNAHCNDSDWDETDRQAEFFFDARDDEQQPWVIDVGLWDYSPRSAMCMSAVYEKLRRYLRPTARKKLDQLFGAFFWIDNDNRCAIAYVQELNDTADPEVFAAAMRPATVQKYLALWDGAVFERLRQPFQTEFPDGKEMGHTPLQSAPLQPADVIRYGTIVAKFDEFKQYAEMWVELLREAVKGKRGLVISVM